MVKEKSNLSREQIEGEKIWNLIFERNINFGGFLIGLFGLMGSGKTSLMLQMIKRIKDEYPDEFIFWREPFGNPFQARNLDNDFQILCEKRHPVKMLKVFPHSNEITNDIKIRIFSGYRDLTSKLQPGMLNVIYYDKQYKWLQLIDKLKMWGTWQTFFFDEFEDVVPQRAKGKQWALNELFANSIKEIRKSRINVVYNTQNTLDIDFRVLTKTMIHLYLYGAKKDKLSPIYKGALHNLELGQGWIDLAHSRFGIIDFKPVFPKEPIYIVLPTDKKK